MCRGSLNATSNPRIGNIIRFNKEPHWAIVKSVASNGTVTVIKQNARNRNGYQAAVGAYILANYADVTCLTYGNNSSTGQAVIVNI